MEVETALAQLFAGRRDDENWETLYEKYWPFVIAVTFRVLPGSIELAEEAAQDTFLTLLNLYSQQEQKYVTLPWLNNERDFRKYLGHIARNRAIDILRKQQLAANYLMLIGNSTSNTNTSAKPQYTPADSTLDLREQLWQLDPLELKIVERIELGWSKRKIVADLGVTRKQIDGLLSKLRARFTPSE